MTRTNGMARLVNSFPNLQPTPGALQPSSNLSSKDETLATGSHLRCKPIDMIRHCKALEQHQSTTQKGGECACLFGDIWTPKHTTL